MQTDRTTPAEQQHSSSLSSSLMHLILLEIGFPPLLIYESIRDGYAYRLRQINIEIVFCENIQMTGVYHTILKCPDTWS